MAAPMDNNNDTTSRIPQTRVESYSRPWADGSIYRFHSETTVTPSTANGVYRIDDRQIIHEVNSSHDADHTQIRERLAMIEQGINTARVRFEIRHTQEEQNFGEEKRCLFDHKWNFEYDLYDAMTNISGWYDATARPTMQRSPARPLTPMPAPSTTPAASGPIRTASRPSPATTSGFVDVDAILDSPPRRRGRRPRRGPFVEED